MRSQTTLALSFCSIPPGLYSVTAEMEGFEKTIRTRVRLNVTENATADLTLKIASATQSIDVKARPKPSPPRMP